MLTNKQPHGLLRLLLRMPILLYRAHMGWLLGGRFLMLTHLGRKSGLPRQVVLEVVHHETLAQLMQLTEAANTFYSYALRHPLAFREISRLMMGEALQINEEDCLRLARSVPLVMLKPVDRL